MPDTPAPADPPQELRCPHCGCKHFHTTPPHQLQHGVRRRRVCRHCGRTLPTFTIRTKNS